MDKESVTDIGIGGSAMTIPLWLQHLEFWAQHFVLIGGSVLLGLRLVLTLIELRKNRQQNQKED